MNKRGQSLITFILILPVIILFVAFIIDSGLSIIEKENVDGILTDNMNMAVKQKNKDVEEIKEVIIKNKDNLDLNIKIENNYLKIKAVDKKKNLFGKIIDLSWYNLEFNYCISYDDRKLNKECK